MSRTYKQISLSRETDSFNLSHLVEQGTVVSVNKTTSSGRGQLFITDLECGSDLISRVVILNGTAHLRQYRLPANSYLSKSFDTPLKVSQGTALTGKIIVSNGTSFINITGYEVK